MTMRRASLMLLMLVLYACAGGPAVPDWQSQSQYALENFRQRYLEGDSSGAARAFARAKAALASTGKPALVVKAELVRCALGVAALDFDACKEYEARRSDATPEDLAYGAFVDGVLEDPQATQLLPSQYREIATAQSDPSRDKALARIADPVSRLVAAGALFRQSKLTPAAVSMAVDTASAQGYRRPLLAYLNVQAKHAQSAGNAAAEEAIRKRIEIVYQSLPDRSREAQR